MELPPRYRTEPLSLVVLACILEALFLWMRQFGDLRNYIVETISLLLIAGLVFLISCHVVLRHSNGTKSRKLAGFIVMAGLIFRFTVWALPPGLSDDPYRYRWEGQLQAAGGNPYTARPIDPEWAGLRDETYSRVVAKDFMAGYGPLVELVERWTYRVVSAWEANPFRQVHWFKLPYALMDLGTMAVLWLWLSRSGLDPGRILIYAWAPAPITEFWATGHNDSLALFFVVLALYAASRRRWVGAFGALSLGTAAKFWPALLFPAFIGWKDRRPQRWWQWLVCLPIFGVLIWPFWTNFIRNARFMSGFVGGWRNNDSLFGILLWLTKDMYHAKYLAFGVIFATVAAVTLLRLPLERAALWVVSVTLMISANCHPWYLTWLLPLLVFIPIPALLLWTVLAPLAYVAVIGWTVLGVWHGSTSIRFYEYIPVYGLLIGTFFVRRWLAVRRGRDSV